MECICFMCLRKVCVCVRFLGFCLHFNIRAILEINTFSSLPFLANHVFFVELDCAFLCKRFNLFHSISLSSNLSSGCSGSVWEREVVCCRRGKRAFQTVWFLSMCLCPFLSLFSSPFISNTLTQTFKCTHYAVMSYWLYVSLIFLCGRPKFYQYRSGMHSKKT